MFAHFFIDRPRFAIVISIIITLAGLISIKTLPIEQYPSITPPQIQVSAVYPGASAKTIQSTVAQVIESQVNGVKGMLYMSSSSIDSSYSLTITFEQGTDDDMAAVDVQNRISLANSKLPQEVINNGISVQKQSSNMLIVMAVSSPKGTYDEIFLSNYVSMNIADRLARVKGVGGVDIFGEKEYSMRIWLNPERMTELKLTYADVMAALNDQNVEAAAGQVGKPPVEDGQQFQYTINVSGRLKSVEEFKDVIIRADSNGNTLKLKDIAKVELGAKNYEGFSTFNGNKGIVFPVYQLTGSNALDVVDNVNAEMKEIAKQFPEDMTYNVMYDTTKFIRSSLAELIETLLVALALVIFVVYVFLQDWRTTIIPTLAIPVSLIGTFAIFSATGFTINTITLFGLILAIGLVVDDAIVVVENAQRKVDDGMDAKTATKKSMDEVTSPIIATTLVLLAVFVPVIFTPGIEGTLYKQFAMTLAISVSISTLNSLTLSPALCAIFLRKPDHKEKKLWIFRWFDHMLEGSTSSFETISKTLIRHIFFSTIVFIAFVVAMMITLKTMPSGFLPDEDQGAVFVNIELPESASLSRTDAFVKQAESKMMQIPGVDSTIAIRGFSIISGQGSNKGVIIASLKDWKERKHYTKSVRYILGQIYGNIATMPGAKVIAFAPPAIMGMGMTGGFELALQDKTDMSDADFAKQVQKLLIAANQDPRLSRVYSTFSINVPQIKLEVDRERAKMLGINIADVFTTLQTYMGSINVNDFNIFGRIYKVTIMADKEFRDDPEDIKKLYVRNNKGDMVPLSAIVKISKVLGQESIGRHNMFRFANVNGSAGMGYSSGEAIKAMEEIIKATMPSTIGYEWTGSALQEQKSTGIEALLPLSLLFMFLFLVAQYESWMMPISVVMVMPIAVIGGLGLGIIGNNSLDLYAQIGILVLAGIACKQAILIVEFAKHLSDQGYTPMDAALTALKLRFRAVTMTAFAFILGITPLLFATGAGAGARQSLGTIVFGGMLLSVLAGTILVPVYFVMIEKLRSRKKK